MPGVFGFIWVAFVFIIVFSTIRKANKEVSKSKGKYSNISGGKVKEERQVITITDFGELFYIVCVKDV